jgi:cytochrome c5
MKLAVITITAVAALLSMGQAAAADEGKATYDKVCAVCHAKGLMSAPKLGDKAAWEPRIKKGGADALTASVIAGKGVMAPRAGVASLSDADIKAAVDYMINQVK